MTLTDLLLPTYRNMLKMLLGLLDKAESQLGADRAEALLAARLAPDMWPLATQLRFAAVQAVEGALRLMGRPLTDWHAAVLDEGRAAGETPGTLADARARIAEALAYLGDLPERAFDQQPETDPIELTLPMGLTFDMTRAQFARDWALSQFYFHAMAAYAILRANGVDIGKKDYVAHMFGYLRGQAG